MKVFLARLTGVAASAVLIFGAVTTAPAQADADAMSGLLAAASPGDYFESLNSEDRSGILAELDRITDRAASSGLGALTGTEQEALRLAATPVSSEWSLVRQQESGEAPTDGIVFSPTAPAFSPPITGSLLDAATGSKTATYQLTIQNALRLDTIKYRVDVAWNWGANYEVYAEVPVGYSVLARYGWSYKSQALSSRNPSNGHNSGGVQTATAGLYRYTFPGFYGLFDKDGIAEIDTTLSWGGGHSARGSWAS